MRFIVSVACAWTALVSLSAAQMPAPLGGNEPLRSSQCPPESRRVPSAKESDVPPPPGIELLEGVTTGMSRKEVHRIDRFLTANVPVHNVELVDGVKLLGNVNFWGRPELAVSVEMRGISKLDRVVAALSRRYGSPLVLKGRATWIDFTAGTQLADRIDFKWCDGARRIALSGDPENFWVTITGRDF